jgi:Polysaccharide deacetylase
MGLSKKIYYQAVSLAPVNLLKKITAVKLLLPYHHVVSDERLTHISHLYTYKNKKQFSKDLDYLLRHFNPIHPLDLIAAVKNKTEIPANSFLLTFDDGFREAYDNVAPLLTAKGVSALFFVNPAFLDNAELCFRNKLSLIIEDLENGHKKSKLDQVSGLLKLGGSGFEEVKAGILQINYKTKEKADLLGRALDISFEGYLQTQKPYLSSEQIHSMIEQGFCFGGHSVDHPNYSLLKIDDQLLQTRDSCRMVRSAFNLNYSAFSFPHYDIAVNQAFFNRLNSEGHQPVDILFGTQNQKQEVFNNMFHRFNAERPDIPVEQAVKGILLYNSIKRRVVRA